LDVYYRIMIRPSMIRCAVLTLLVGAGDASAQDGGGLERYDSTQPAAVGSAPGVGAPRASVPGLAFVISFPKGWLSTAWGGVRTRFFLSDSRGAHAATTFIDVDLVQKDEAEPDGLLLEAGGLPLWLEATRPRYEIEDRRRTKVGGKGVSCESLLVKDPAHRAHPDRRELLVVVPAKGGAFLLRFSAPLTEFSSHAALWKSILESFEPKPG
jgi:hypothetical protein